MTEDPGTVQIPINHNVNLHLCHTDRIKLLQNMKVLQHSELKKVFFKGQGCSYSIFFLLLTNPVKRPNAIMLFHP